jgi:hypothetical protein
MAQISGTTWTNSTGANALTMATNVRESLEDVIFLLDPMDTWAVSNLPRGEKPGNVFHEWLGDTLAAAAANRQVEGDDATYSTANAATRYGNYLQISRKTFLVSRTLESVNKAGRRSEVARLGTKLMKELKRDMENAIVTNQSSSAGGATTARSLGSMESWIAGPTSTNGAAANAVATTSISGATTVGFSGGVVTTPTDAASSTGALTEAVLKAALQGAWAQGGDPRIILLGATQKKVLDAFAGIATRFIDSSPSKEATIVGAANMYVSEFGSPHAVILSRYVRSSVVLCIDPDYWAISYLDAPFTESLAKTGDGNKKQMVSEYTLVCRNPFASSKVVGCT